MNWAKSFLAGINIKRQQVKTRAARTHALQVNVNLNDIEIDASLYGYIAHDANDASNGDKDSVASNAKAALSTNAILQNPNSVAENQTTVAPQIRNPPKATKRTDVITLNLFEHHSPFAWITSKSPQYTKPRSPLLKLLLR